MLSVIQPYTHIHIHITISIHSSLAHLPTCLPAASDAIMKMLRNGANVHGAHNEIKRQHYSHFFNTSWKSGNKANVVFFEASQ